MTMTPLATIADALIDFILSLLRDPAAAEEYQADPEGTLDRAGLGGACLADVRSVAPVVYDHPDVVVRQQPVYVSNPTGPSTPSHPSTPVERAIQNIVNNFSIDNRATVVDQSVNQNIWAHGDVNQLFDQGAVINTGDHGTAAGHDAIVDNSSTDVGGDLNVGNTTTETTVNDSFNDTSTTTDDDTTTTVTDSYNDTSATTSADDTVVNDSFNVADNSDDSTDVTDSGNSTTQVVVDDTAGDVSITVDDGPPEDLFADDQP